MDNEGTKVLDYYANLDDFLNDLKSVKVRRLKNESDKRLIQKLKRWVREYWNEEEGMDLYKSQYLRLKMMIEEQNNSQSQTDAVREF